MNPADKKSKDLLKMAEAFYVHSAPTRIGLLLLVNDKENVDATKDAGVALWRAFQYIKKEDSAFRGLSFITDVSNRVVKQSTIYCSLQIHRFLSSAVIFTITKITKSA